MSLSLPELCAELQSLQRRRKFALKCRNQQLLCIQSIVARDLGYHPSLPEAERSGFYEKAREMIDVVKDDLGSDYPLAPVVQASMVGVKGLDKLKGDYEKSMLKMVKQLPVASWVDQPDQRGFGKLFLGIVIGETGDLHNYDTWAKLWRRMACAPWEYNGVTRMGASWRCHGLPAEEWEQYGYSPQRRSISYLIGEGLVKQNQAGPYRKLYDKAKEEFTQANPDEPKIHAHRHGMLLATKRLYRNLWMEWNKDVRVVFEICPVTEKVTHTTHQSARGHLGALERKYAYEGCVYACDHCKGYHVGRKLKKPKPDLELAGV